VIVDAETIPMHDMKISNIIKYLNMCNFFKAILSTVAFSLII
jgi:hypothetical protein